MCGETAEVGRVALLAAGEGAVAAADGKSRISELRFQAGRVTNVDLDVQSVVRPSGDNASPSCLPQRSPSSSPLPVTRSWRHSQFSS